MALTQATKDNVDGLIMDLEQSRKTANTIERNFKEEKGLRSKAEKEI